MFVKIRLNFLFVTFGYRYVNISEYNPEAVNYRYLSHIYNI